MTIYVDEIRMWPHARHRCFKSGSAHLTADTVEELHAFAGRLGMKRSWFQPLSSPHYDLSPNKHTEALRLGAVFVPARVQARHRLALRNDSDAREVLTELRLFAAFVERRSRLPDEPVMHAYTEVYGAVVDSDLD